MTVIDYLMLDNLINKPQGTESVNFYSVVSDAVAFIVVMFLISVVLSLLYVGGVCLLDWWKERKKYKK